MEDFSQLFNSFSSLKIGVIGDVMLDTYMVGHVDRISPEAPVPVISLHHKEYRIGGAGNVALNCRSLGAQVSVLSVTGDDANGLLFLELLDSHDINTSYLLKSSDRITTSKTRIISRNQQMMRVDEEMTSDLSDADEKALLEKVQQYISANDPDVIIFEDYNKGILTPGVIKKVMHDCKNTGIITAVDPKRKNFFSYKGADIFKPNLKEVREALNLLSDSTDITALQKMHTALHQQLNNKISFITLSDKGVFYHDGSKGEIIASHLRHIADVSGAGDTVIAVAAMVYAVSKNTKQMAEIANIAGGLVCEEVGTVAVNKEKLLKECASLLR
jgi:rfaE bifunctional protein kinase chain/domain